MPTATLSWPTPSCDICSSAKSSMILCQGRWYLSHMAQRSMWSWEQWWADEIFTAWGEQCHKHSRVVPGTVDVRVVADNTWCTRCKKYQTIWCQIFLPGHGILVWVFTYRYTPKMIWEWTTTTCPKNRRISSWLSGFHECPLSRRYATEEFMRSMFPTAPELKLSLLYPVLKLVAMPRSHEVQNFELLDGQEHYSLQGKEVQTMKCWWMVKQQAYLILFMTNHRRHINYCPITATRFVLYGSLGSWNSIAHFISISI